MFPFIQFQGISLEEYKNKYMLFKLFYKFHQTPYGTCLVAITETNKVAYLKFIDNDYGSALSDLDTTWPLTTKMEDTENRTNDIIRTIFYPDGFRIIGVIMRGTEFQCKVWETLTHIPRGTVVTYKEIEEIIDIPGAARAVGNVISKNYIAYAVPCHRVVSKNGENKYAWGVERKEAMLQHEKQHRN